MHKGEFTPQRSPQDYMDEKHKIRMFLFLAFILEYKVKDLIDPLELCKYHPIPVTLKGPLCLSQHPGLVTIAPVSFPATSLAEHFCASKVDSQPL